MVNDLDLELISLMELKEIKREKRLNEAGPDYSRQITASNDLNCPSDHFSMILTDTE